MRFEVTILFPGFSGKLPYCAHGWGTWALIRDGKHNILLDTGGVGLRLNFHRILEEQGVRAEDIDYVLLTHMHFDHVCNMDLLPNAVFVLSQKEWEHANDMENRDLFIQESAILPMRNAKKIFVKEDGQQILPGITALMTPGHTPGSVSYVLHQDHGEAWVLAGDAAKNRGELCTRDVQMSLNPADSAASLEKIVRTADRILPGHDGWIRVEDERLLPEGGNDVELVFAQGITVNGGQTRITIHMD
ncbi:MAG: MBL fold metallo-hydrolase [Lachnospiraceae bacterium]|jgi:N-acyl homoserine lactone hydrolase|nr:MBL fold metallo-hydrolase [Lachnospiraceae bacterium]MCI8996143.1 MBL fold metallo-hydrolase [Lachnospiraceae bacterium]MCI9134557.1 MBL fold metallo-hydrolase [Lachnospiraceae bacterium]